jgi:predicted small lipoprotein YifL
MSGRVFFVAVTISLTLGLAACGRKGPLDLPPSDTPTPQANSNLTRPSPSFGPASLMPGSQQQPPQQQPSGPPNAYDSQGHPIYLPPSKNKSFILDPILN